MNFKAMQKEAAARLAKLLKDNHFSVTQNEGGIQARILPTHPRLSDLPDECKEVRNFPKDLEPGVRALVEEIEREELERLRGMVAAEVVGDGGGFERADELGD